MVLKKFSRNLVSDLHNRGTQFFYGFPSTLIFHLLSNFGLDKEATYSSEEVDEKSGNWPP